MKLWMTFTAMVLATVFAMTASADLKYGGDFMTVHFDRASNNWKAGDVEIVAVSKDAKVALLSLNIDKEYNCTSDNDQMSLLNLGSKKSDRRANEAYLVWEIRCN